MSELIKLNKESFDKVVSAGNKTLMKPLLTFLFSITLISKVFAFTVHTSYDASSD